MSMPSSGLGGTRNGYVPIDNTSADSMFENVNTTEVNETYGREEVIIDENVPAVEI